MIIDGKKIASDIEAQVLRALTMHTEPPTLAIIVAGENPVTANFVRMKKTVAGRLNIPVIEHVFREEADTEILIERINTLNSDVRVKGIIVQLPLPSHVDTQKVLNSISLTKDVDVLSVEAMAAFRRGESRVLPPVAGAVQEILERANAQVAGHEALVLGNGRLVGQPVALLLRHLGARVTVIDQPISDLKEYTRESALIVSGVGQPGLITNTMLAHGTMLIDAGTSEVAGKLCGDIDASCVEGAALFTPVPGGVGPITIAMIFKNLCMLNRHP